MAKTTRVNEAPMDFMRGAGRETANKVRNSGFGSGIRDVLNAGREASASADANKAVGKLADIVTTLGKQLAQYQSLRKSETDLDSEADNKANREKDEQNNINPEPTRQQDGKPIASKDHNYGGQANAFRSTTKPKGRVGQNGFEYTFDSFNRQLYADQSQLDEGFMDFLKGASGSMANKLRDKYAGSRSTFGDIYKAGVNSHRSAENVKSKTQLAAEITKTVQQINAIGAKLGDKAADAITNAVKQQIESDYQQAALRLISKQKQKQVQ